MSAKKRDLKMAGKLALAEIARLSVLIAGLAFVRWGLPVTPGPVLLVAYLTGAALTFMGMYMALTNTPAPKWKSDNLYARYSAMGIVVLMWPVFMFFVSGPEIVENIIRTKLGLPSPRTEASA